MQERLAVLHRDLDALARQALREREERLRGLQLAARSLRQAESTAQWVQILADAAAPLASAVCFFRVDGDSLRCEAVRGMDVADGGAIALADAPAFRQAVETKETVVSLVAASQLSGAVAEAFGGARRAHLFPLVGKTRVLGVLAATGEPALDVYGLEVLLSLGAAALELREAKGTTLIGAAAPAAKAAPAHSEAPPTALRFARRAVAQWMLDAPAQVAAGRTQGDLYGSMRKEIDAARSDFRSRYWPGPDYLHDEILARLALGSAALLGSGYPGPIGAADDA